MTPFPSVYCRVHLAMHLNRLMWSETHRFHDNYKEQTNPPLYGVLLRICTGVEHTAWCSEIGLLQSLGAPELHASSDVREPISLHQSVLAAINFYKFSVR